MDIERLGPNDLMTLASDRGPAPMNIAAVLELERDVGFGVVRDLLGRRLVRVPRLRQRLHRLPPGLGRPMWLDDPAFDLDRHLDSVSLPAPNENALLGVAAELACTPLDRRQPLWRARWVDGLPDGRAAIVLALHHVIAWMSWRCRSPRSGMPLIEWVGRSTMSSSPLSSGRSPRP